MKIRKITYPTSLEKISDVFNDNIDVLVETEDRKNYVLTVCTPEYYISKMKKEKTNFIPAGCPDIIVNKLTDDVIKEALENFCEYDGYWLKLYYLVGINEDTFSIESMNQMLDKMDKE